MPDSASPEGRQVGPSDWLVLGGPIAWGAATDEILAMGEVLAVPATGDQALHGIGAHTGAWRVVDYAGARLGVSGSGTHAYFTWVTLPPDPPTPQLVERSLVDGHRRVWNEGVRFVLSQDDALFAYSTAPWAGMIDSLVVERLATSTKIAAVPAAIPLAFSPDASQLLVWNGSYASPVHRVLTLANGSLVPLPLGVPAGALALDPPLWDSRGVLVIHASGADTTVVTLRNVTTGIDAVLLRATGTISGTDVAWSRDGRYAAFFTQQAVVVPEQTTLAREISVWVVDTVAATARRIASTRDAVSGRPLQGYAGAFSPDGADFAWEAGGTLFVAPTGGAR